MVKTTDFGPRNIASKEVTVGTNDLSGAVASDEHLEVSTLNAKVTVAQAGGIVTILAEGSTDKLAVIYTDSLGANEPYRWDPEYVLPDNKKLQAVYSGTAGGTVLISGGAQLASTPRSK